MKGRFLTESHETFVEPNIYADKSSLVLEWLLSEGIQRDWFSIREVVGDTGISLGQVQKVFRVLTINGYLQTEGLRTAKKFLIKKPQLLLKDWLDNYSIVKKCKMRTYRTGLSGRKELLEKLAESNLQNKTALALHSAAKSFGCKNTNLETLELYLLENSARQALEEILHLDPCERGYEVLLIEPYYKSMLKHSKNSSGTMRCSSAILTFLDLYHFPLRGHEQAEFMAERITPLKQINKAGR